MLTVEQNPELKLLIREIPWVGCPSPKLKKAEHFVWVFRVTRCYSSESCKRLGEGGLSGLRGGRETKNFTRTGVISLFCPSCDRAGRETADIRVGLSGDALLDYRRKYSIICLGLGTKKPRQLEELWSSSCKVKLHLKLTALCGEARCLLPQCLISTQHAFSQFRSFFRGGRMA